MVGPTEGQRFCQRCGRALVFGRCPEHGVEVSNPSARIRVAHPPTAPAEAPPRPGPDWSSYRFAPESGNGRSSAVEAIPTAYPPAEPVAPLFPALPVKPVVRRPIATWIGAGIAVLLLVGLVADHVTLQHSIDSNRKAVTSLGQRLSAQLAATNALAGKVAKLENKAADPATVARTVQASVYTIDTPDGLGSGWVVSAGGGASKIVTDYHVVQSVWNSTSAHTVGVRQNSTTLTGTITQVDKGDDLALITVPGTLVALPRSSADAMVGDAVLVVGSPLGLTGTVANGIVSSFRDGLIQFSAPISPGDSGGPVVNSSGQVIGVAESKIVGSGVEGLSFAIPISTVCSTVATC